MPFRFCSTIKFGRGVPSARTELVKNEPMLFSCNLHVAEELGGPLTRRFLNYLPGSWLNAPDLIIDSRVHMLMPGWFPCIPGYHHDDVPRTRSDGQPNYETPEYKSEHCMLMLGDDIARTEFAIGNTVLPDVPLGQTIYKRWHKHIEVYLRLGTMKRLIAPMDQIIFFDWQTFHQGVRATGNGWRFFIRASRNTYRKPSNELRRQVQVYLENPMEGW